MTTIYTRSPYKIAMTGTVGQQMEVRLYIYNYGDLVPSIPTRVLTKPIPSSVLTTVYFNVSPYIQEFIEHIIFTEINANSNILSDEYALCKVETYKDSVLQTTTTYKALNGYGYNSEGWNKANTVPTALMTEGTYLIDENSYGALYFDTVDDGVTYTVSYYDLVTGSLIDDATFNTSIAKIPVISTDSLGSTGNKLVITNADDDVVFESEFIFNCNGKYSPIDIDFVNRFGVWQRLTMFGAQRESIETNGTDYKFMNRSANFNPDLPTEKILNVNGNRTLKLNTGLVDEFYKDVILQLSLSETIMIDDVPYKLTTRMSDLPNHTNVKQINYALDFKEANQLINTGV